ncbi:MAG: hypothetical protein A2Y67_00315 [Candidatus Buchananbacteria bacterium RBG_13_39_9]|uniref:Uncharacterized protein n=1 Tax=Candidatus Buchananbacteria bacterium RBG_13_39_9 TaxID=1797531 RepID=A0A1G1XQY7_9BACT|nr:MAG: hypothetical protein A2Y67_00315 [Candidatus Buchananbacteria bacterium RBG_13_39_9]
MAEKGKKDAAKKEVENPVLGWRESFLLEYLTAIFEAQSETSSEPGKFNEALAAKLGANGDLITKIKAKPHIARRVVGDLPCGHRVVREFIKEVLRTQPLLRRVKNVKRDK